MVSGNTETNIPEISVVENIGSSLQPCLQCQDICAVVKGLKDIKKIRKKQCGRQELESGTSTYVGASHRVSREGTLTDFAERHRRYEQGSELAYSVLVALRVPMVKRRRGGKMGAPRENLACQRHVFHMRKSGRTLPGSEPGSPWWEAIRKLREALPLSGTRRPDLPVGSPAGCSGDLSPSVPLVAGSMAPLTLLGPPHVLVCEIFGVKENIDVKGFVSFGEMDALLHNDQLKNKERKTRVGTRTRRCTCNTHRITAFPARIRRCTCNTHRITAFPARTRRCTCNTHRITAFPARTRRRTSPADMTRSETVGWSGAGIQGWGKPEYPEKTRRPAASSSTIPTCENPDVNPPGIEPGSPCWEASALATAPPLPLPRPDDLQTLAAKECQYELVARTLQHGPTGTKQALSNFALVTTYASQRQQTHEADVPAVICQSDLIGMHEQHQPVSPEHSCVVAKRIGNSSRREEVCDASKSRRCRHSRDSQKGHSRDSQKGRTGGRERIVPGRGEGEAGLRLRRGAAESAPAAARNDTSVNLRVRGQEVRERYGRQLHTRLVPRRSYTQGVQCFRREEIGRSSAAIILLAQEFFEAAPCKFFGQWLKATKRAATRSTAEEYTGSRTLAGLQKRLKYRNFDFEFANDTTGLMRHCPSVFRDGITIAIFLRHCSNFTTLVIGTKQVKVVHYKASTFEISLGKKSLPLPAYVVTGALSDTRPEIRIHGHGAAPSRVTPCKHKTNGCGEASREGNMPKGRRKGKGNSKRRKTFVPDTEWEKKKKEFLVQHGAIRSRDVWNVFSARGPGLQGQRDGLLGTIVAELRPGALQNGCVGV
ncbi:hypothetical protein PR048_031289 [Dryococelus australis]|uniref:Uncharacterized protein n=1 Tax=Dryococelus australis TaxID=614101 RepID=A0ABQ9G4W0_9NEOP|nr:hypothetical protein PR048_031289 [Dryococelus australis]